MAQAAQVAIAVLYMLDDVKRQCQIEGFFFAQKIKMFKLNARVFYLAAEFDGLWRDLVAGETSIIEHFASSKMEEYISRAATDISHHPRLKPVFLYHFEHLLGFPRRIFRVPSRIFSIVFATGVDGVDAHDATSILITRILKLLRFNIWICHLRYEI